MFIFFFYSLDTTATAIERSRPWLHSQSSDDIELTTQSSPKQISRKRNDPNIHPTNITAKDVSSSYQKSPEYMGQLATTTKPEENTSRPKASELFDQQSKTTTSEQKNNNNLPAELNATRL